MQKIIYKFDLSEKKDHQIPKNSKLLSVGLQGAHVMLWVEATLNEEEHETRSFMLIWTGQSYDSTNTEFIGTLQRDWEVIHVFEIK